jgi:[acyl-carrier-protein] S-malonyltransferase
VLWFDNLQSILGDGGVQFIEFGGGIGSGETPAAKRPNLEGMIKKVVRGMDSSAQYLPVINCQTLRETAAALLEMG